MRRRSVQAAALLVLLVVASRAVWAADPQFTVVQVDLNSGALSQGLPFDVRFLLTGPIDQKVQEVNVAFVQMACDEVQQASAPVKWTSQPSWRSLELTPAPASPSPQKFTVLMPPLEVNRQYCLRFTVSKSITGPELESFRAAAARNVSGVLNSLLQTANLSTADLAGLRVALRNAVQTSTAGLDVHTKERSIFDERVPIDTFAGGVRELVQVQIIPRVRARDLRDTVDRQVRDRVHALVTDADVARVASAAQATAAGNDAFAVWRSAAETARIYASRSEALWDQMTDATAGTSVDGLVSWTSADAANAVKRLNVVQTDCRTIRGLFEALHAQPAFRNAANVSDDTVQKVLTEVKAVCGDPTTNDTGALGDEERRLTDLQAALMSRESMVQSVTDNFVVNASAALFEDAVTTADFNTRHSWYVSADVGVALAPRLHSGFAYSGANIYFRPVNKEAPLQQFHGKARIARSVSAMVGLTITDLTKAGQRSNLIGSQMLVAGGGMRVTESMRLNGGVVVYQAEDTNPTVSRQKVAATPFVSFSYDFDVASTLGALGRLLPSK